MANNFRLYKLMQFNCNDYYKSRKQIDAYSKSSRYCNMKTGCYLTYL